MLIYKIFQEISARSKIFVECLIWFGELKEVSS